MIPLHYEHMPDAIADILAPTMLGVAVELKDCLGVSHRREGELMPGLLPGDIGRNFVLRSGGHGYDMMLDGVGATPWVLDLNLHMLDARIACERRSRRRNIPAGFLVRPVSLILVFGESANRSAALIFGPHATGHDVLGELRALSRDFPDMFTFVGEASDE